MTCWRVLAGKPTGSFPPRNTSIGLQVRKDSRRVNSTEIALNVNRDTYALGYYNRRWFISDKLWACRHNA